MLMRMSDANNAKFMADPELMAKIRETEKKQEILANKVIDVLAGIPYCDAQCVLEAAMVVLKDRATVTYNSKFNEEGDCVHGV